METLAYKQILILIIQCFLVGILLLLLFRLRTLFGLGLLYIAIGLFKFMHYFYSQAFAVEILPGINVSIGSTVMYSGVLFAVLLIYLQEDALEARKVIYALMIFNVFFAILLYATGLGMGESGFINRYNLPASFFEINLRSLFIGTLVIFIDSVVLIIVYEAISKILSSLFLRIFLTMAIVLVAHSVLFNFGYSFGTPAFKNNILAGLYSKLIAVPVFSLTIWLYLIYFEKKMSTKENPGSKLKDIYNLFTYRQKFEKIVQEKVMQEKELETKTRLVETLVSTIPDLIWLKDIEGRYLICNTGYEDYFGHDEASIIGKTDHDYINQTLAEKYRKTELHILNTSEASKEVELLTFASSGYQGWFEITKTPMFNKAGEIIGILGIGRDITELKNNIEELKKHRNNLEELVSERAAELKAANAELQEINELFVGREARIIELKEELKAWKK